MMSESKKAVVLLSGGLDSATCLAIARSEGYQCYAMSFDYGQRHESELNEGTGIIGGCGFTAPGYGMTNWESGWPLKSMRPMPSAPITLRAR